MYLPVLKTTVQNYMHMHLGDYVYSNERNIQKKQNNVEYTSVFNPELVNKFN